MSTTPPAGRLIVFEFSVFDESGEKLGSNVGERPRVCEVGTDEILPAARRAHEIVELVSGDPGASRQGASHIAASRRAAASTTPSGS